MGKTRIALVGFGAMGKITQEVALSKGKNIVTTIDPNSNEAAYKNIDSESLQGADVAICFTHPSSVFENVNQLTQAQVKIVMATTGWEKDRAAVLQLLTDRKGGMVYSSNYSIGVNLFFALVAKATELFGAFHEYEPYMIETHHSRKLDSPSGTALKLAEILTEKHPTKKKFRHANPIGKLAADEFHLSSVRGGDVPGTHTLVFDSSFDSIELEHRARTRQGFAAGALFAAEWIQGRTGFFTEKDLFSF